MWRHEDLWCVTGAGGNPRLGLGPSPDLADYLSRASANDEAPPVNLPLPPIMHGTGLLSAIGAMTHGGTCVTLTGRSFEAHEALAAVDRHRVTASHHRRGRLRPAHGGEPSMRIPAATTFRRFA